MAGVTEIEYLRQYIQSESELFTSRVNLFFVAEAMLFVSYVTSLIPGIIDIFTYEVFGSMLDIIPSLLIWLGITTAIIFLFVLRRHAINNHQTKQQLKDIDIVYKEIFNLRKKRFGSADIVLSQLLPGAFLFAWWILWLFTVENFKYCIGWMFAPTIIFFILWIYQYIVIKKS